MMKKTINVVVYPIGLGGNIIRFLLSLHTNTFPLYPKKEFNEDQPRHEIYSFKNIRWKYGNWSDYEFSDSWQKTRSIDYLTMFLGQNKYDTLTIADHPDETDFEIFKKTNVDFNFLTVDVSEKYHTSVIQFLKSNQLPPYDILKKSESSIFINDYKKNFKPYVINHDCFLEGEETFIHEYKRLLTHLNYTLDKDVLTNAMTLYRGWHSARMTILPKKTYI